MNDRDVMRKAVRERILNRAAIRDRAIERAEERLRQPGLRVQGNAPRKLVLVANILLLTLVIGLIAATTGKYWLPADETTAPTTTVVTTTVTSETTAPTTATPTTTATSRITGTLAGEPVDSKAADFVATFQSNLWASLGDPAAPYPDYYAGAYYEKPLSLEGFTVLVTCDPNLVKSTLDEAIDESIRPFVSPMTIVQVQHSYNELLTQYNAVQQVLTEQADNLSEADREIIAQIERAGIDEKENKIFIEVKEGAGIEKETLDRILTSLYGSPFSDAEILLVYEAETQPTLSTMDAVRIFHEYLIRNNLERHVTPNAEWGGLPIRLPDSFSSVTDGFNIGEFLFQVNELSNQNGLDLSGYLGKIVIMCPDNIETSDGMTPIDVVGLVADGKVVGFWLDEDTEREFWDEPDFRIMLRYLWDAAAKK